jgi:hypothetical protein
MDKAVEYTLIVEYPADLYFEEGLDSDIEQAAGTDSDGSGMGFGFRDMSFTFPSETAAQAAEKRIRKLHPKIETSVAECEF